jgi:hypothetical protein
MNERVTLSGGKGKKEEGNCGGFPSSRISSPAGKPAKRSIHQNHVNV